MNYCVIPNKHNIWGFRLRNCRFILIATKRGGQEEGLLRRLLSLTQRHLAKLMLEVTHLQFDKVVSEDMV